jgi:hypothetical protein
MLASGKLGLLNAGIVVVRNSSESRLFRKKIYIPVCDE